LTVKIPRFFSLVHPQDRCGEAVAREEYKIIKKTFKVWERGGGRERKTKGKKLKETFKRIF